MRKVVDICETRKRETDWWGRGDKGDTGVGTDGEIQRGKHRGRHRGWDPEEKTAGRQRGRARRSETEGGEKVRDTEMETETGREVEYTTSG